ncbi:AEC family transporter [Rhizobium sp. XQZ8]|uniref:AEC family transporter n=1 Tax=Rhizobium populisoli TaxID=2859785 RepID=UPI001C670F74|nr:AEC family transporter [Rhizobium populisoli]MBW6423624.1 AEC family transporter [Rhizobium populisoli]
MSSVFVNVVPVFVLILIGWVMAKTGILKQETGDALGEFVFKIAVPMLIFRTLADAHFEGVSPFRLWGAYFAGVAVTWTVGHLVATRLFKRDAKMGVITGMSGSFANNVFIGLPLVDHMVGKDGLVAISILLAIHLPLMMVIGTILMESAAAKVDGGEKRGVGAVLKQVGSNLARNPLVIGLLAGVIFNLSGITMTPAIGIVVNQLAAAASPVALISIGMALTRYPIRGDIGLSATSAALKLLLLPAMVFTITHLMGLPRDWSAALVLTSSVPTGINAWLIAQRFRSGHSLAASVISITTAFGVFTVSFWAWLLS